MAARPIYTVAALLCFFAARAQQDTVVRSFADSNQARVFGGLYHTYLTAGRDFHRNPRLSANTSAYMGGAFLYRWAVIAFAFNIPQTSVYHGQEMKAYQLTGGVYRSHWGIEGTAQLYKGLVDQTPVGAGVVSAPWQWADFRFVSVNAIYFKNDRRFSYDAADNFNKRQTQSGGSLIFMLTPGYQDFTFQKSQADTAFNKTNPLYSLIQKDASHGLVVAKAGYAYAFSWDKGLWTLSPLIAAGPGAGVLVQSLSLHPRESFFPLIGYQGRLAVGYNGPQWFVYGSAYYDLIQNPEKGSGLKTINESASVNIGYRFASLKHRILHLL